MSLERKYQVFVSSTFKDLRPEREKVQLALLESDCIPIGMELFPPSDETQWEYIKKVIEQCDYYVLILAGRYGSTDSLGVSYTEKEYRHAEIIKKPIITFYHFNPDVLAHDKVEKDPESQLKLENFRKLVLSKLCRQYEDANQLYGCVINGINHLKKLRPEGGWIPARLLPTDNIMKELDALKTENMGLKRQLEENKTGSTSVNAIDSMPNHIAARSQMRAFILESLRTADSVQVKVIGVSLFFTWDFLYNQLPIFLNTTAPYKKIVVDLVMVEPAYLETIGLKDWKLKGEHSQQDIKAFISEEKRDAGLIANGRLELSLHEYRNIPHWHGTLINNNFLFLGRTRWTIHGNEKICQLTVGEEIYRLFSATDQFGGADRIDLFNSWFNYYQYSGKAIASGNLRGA